jgi:hypothetical protein
VKSFGPTVAETRAVGDQHVTVFAPESSLRREILGSVEHVDVDANGCPTRAVLTPTVGPQGLEPDSLSVCVYSQDTGVTTLMYSGNLPGDTARAYAGQVAAATTKAGAGCPTPSRRWVALGLTGDQGVRWDVVNLGCDRIQTAGDRTAPLTPDTVAAWATRGVTAYVSAPEAGGDALAEYFRAPPD